MSKEKEIGEVIKEALNGHEENYIEGAWETFKSKKKRRALIYRLSASGIAAAVLLGLIIIGTLNQPLPQTLTAQKEPVKVIEPPQQIVNEVPGQVAAVAESQPSSISVNRLERVASASAGRSTSSAVSSTKSEVSSTKSAVSSTNIIAQNTEKNEAAEVKSTAVKESQTQTQTQTQTQKQPTNQLNNQPLTQLNSLSTTESAPQSSQQDSKLGSGRRVRIGVNVAPGFNTTADASAFNYSGGVNVEIPLSKKLQISTGVSLEHSNVDERSSPRNAAVPSYQTIASLTNLDIPINITWKISSYKKTSYYVGAGLSALAYLSENYTTTTRTQLLRENTSFDGDEYISTYKLETIERVTTSSGSPNSAFDIGGRVNLIFGVEQRLTPKLNLSIEPFMKIPVSGLATKNMIYTTGGVTFKVTF
ncbi:MAG: outer membrane beta-barrel protein [Bacteroidales bacterium]|nr:outer membrane beta-barrel protein [Bacteroidales bacterium]